MPRKPTVHARLAEAGLRRLIASSRPGKYAPLPTVRALAAQMDVSYATISRILGRLAQESVAWRHPNGRFYPAAARERVSKGLPVILLGRQVQHWSVLYREILEGVSEVCSARGCPLVFLSSDKLVRHDSPAQPPVFAGEKIQRKELERLLSSLPKPYGGILFDHLWSDRLITAARRSHPACCLLVRCHGGWESIGHYADTPGPLRRTAPTARFHAHGKSTVKNRRTLEPFDRNAAVGSAGVNCIAAAETMIGHLADCGYRRILIGNPFAHDQAVDASREAVAGVIARWEPRFDAVRIVDCSTPGSRTRLISGLRRVAARTALISIEDNVTSLLWEGFQAAGIDCPGTVGLASLQGTAALGAPITRLRYDYRRLGREAVAAVLGEKLPVRSFRPVLIRGKTTGGAAGGGDA